jgi:predicted nucleic acid-binding Zn ribbon protein
MQIDANEMPIYEYANKHNAKNANLMLIYEYANI